MFTTLVMFGMDQDMMQKNLTCKTKKEAQINMVVFSLSFLISVFLFLCLGALLYIFAADKGIAIPQKSDDLYPLIAMNHMSLFVGIAFLMGITAAAYSSADSALTALTTAFSVDFLKIEQHEEIKRQKIKKQVHLLFSVLLIIVILLFRVISNESVVVAVFTVAGYTYGPILGLFLFGIYTRKKIKDHWVPFVAFVSPVACFMISKYSETLLFGYRFGFELLILNGLLTMLGLWAISKKDGNKTELYVNNC
jgi:Na+/proline symporter